MAAVELGLDTFGDVSLGPNGQLKPMDQVLRDVVDEAVLADELGIHFIGLGEHHRSDFAIAAPEILLAAIAARTTKIKLGTAVTVLSSDDPIRVFQRFSTLNALSNGRAEPILGRGSFTESYPLFGYDLADYDALFAEYKTSNQGQGEQDETEQYKPGSCASISSANCCSVSLSNSPLATISSSRFWPDSSEVCCCSENTSLSIKVCCHLNVAV